MSNHKVKLLVILPSLHAGGAENYVLRLIRFAGTKYYEWHVLSPNLERGDLHYSFQEVGANISYKKISYTNPINFIKLYLYLKQENFDSISSFNGVFGGVSLYIAKAVGIKIRICWHRRSTPAFNPTFLRNLYAKLAIKLLEISCTRILSNSRSALDYFHGVGWIADKRFGVIPNGVDAGLYISDIVTKAKARYELGIPIDGYVVGHVGRYDPAKNHETIFRVAAELVGRMSVITFVFCGKGTDSPQFQQQIERFGISAHCIALGLQENLPRVYRSFDVFYFPSVTEGQPNALIEAVLSRVPIVASDIPGIREAMPSIVYPKLLHPLDVEQAVDAILAQRHPLEADTSTIFDWALDRYDLKRNMSLSLQSLLNTEASNYQDA